MFLKHLLRPFAALSCSFLIGLAVPDAARAGNSIYNMAVLSDGPLGFWTFDETTGTTASDLATTAGAPQNGAQNGTFQNCTLGQTSGALNLGTCAQFNGTSSRVVIPYTSLFDLGTGNFSVELWYKTSSTARGDMFNFKNTIDFGIFSNNNGTGTLSGWHNGALPVASITPINTWHHVVFVRNGTTITLYVNGTAAGSQTDTVSMSAGTDITIGDNKGALWFTGWIDEVAYYPSALTAARVAAHYSAASQANANAPVVVTGAATAITSSSATIAGSLSQVGSPSPTVTMYWGPTNGGTVPGNWANAVALGTQTGAFSMNLSGLNAATLYYYAAYATNASGESWGLPVASFTTANGPPSVVNVPASGITSLKAIVGAQVTSTGGATPTVTMYYGTTDGGTTAGNWSNSVNLGAQTGTATTQLTGLTMGLTYYFRAFATNGSGSAWAPSTATFATPLATLPTVVTDAATEVNGFSATLRGRITSIGNDPPIVKIYYGQTDGGTTTASWTSLATLPVQTGNFASVVSGLLGNTTYYFRARAENAAGGVWAATGSSFTTPALVSSPLVINEIHYHPVEQEAFNTDGNPVLNLTEDVHEFVEIYNPGASSVSLAGAKLSGGVGFTFPSGSSIAAGGYVVIAKNPTRLGIVYPALTNILGPYTGTLGNGSDSVRLKNAAGDTLDLVNYNSRFPWPTAPDAMGAADDFTLLNSADYQYKGRSLQRVSSLATSNDPANWRSSPIGAAPTPGAVNASPRAVPWPVPVSFSAFQSADDAPVIRATQSVRINVTLSSTAGLSNPQVEYFVDNINSFSEAHAFAAMTDLGGGQFSAVLPGQADRSVVRYRVVAAVDGTTMQIAPRTDDALIVPVSPTTRENWWSYWVTPVRTSTNPIYDLFVSDSGEPVSDTTGANLYPFNGLNGVQNLAYNATGNPKRATTADTNGFPRDIPYVAATDRLWNGSVPAIFIENGNVRDIHFRLHGSRYNRRPSRTTYKLRFPDTQKFQEADSEFITDKTDYFSVMHGLYVNANLPISPVRWIDWYMNNGAKAVKLEQGEYNGDLLDKFHARQARLNPGQTKETRGEFYKNVGIINGFGEEGPYSTGDGRLLVSSGIWSTIQKYQWTFLLQCNGWKGATPMKSFFDGLWTARGDTPAAPNPNLTNLRAYMDSVMDVDTALTSMAILNWGCPWDDTSQNHFFWRRANNRWVHFPWDFDGFFGNGDNTGSGSSIYLGEVGLATVYPGNNSRGPNYFKDSLFKAYRTEYNERLWLLNNTYLHPDNLKTLFFTNGTGGQVSYYAFINGVKANFCEERFASVNTQTGHAADGSDFQRPNRPTHVAPVAGATALPPTVFTVSNYAHSSGNSAGANAHAKSFWEIRLSTGSYFEPVFTRTSTTSLTSLPIPFDELTFGQTYYWRVTFTDAAGHPSVPSLETAFVYGPQGSSQTLISLSDVWKYNQVQAFNDATWTAANFDDSNATNWPSGQGVLAAETQAQIPAEAVIRTPLIAPNVAGGRITIYFRKHFNINVNPATLSNLRIRHFIDDGCVIYINGTRVHRYRMADLTAYLYTQLSASSPGDAVSVFADASPSAGDSSYIDPRPYLVQGDNVIAVEVHQSAASSSDTVMGLELTATVPSIGGEISINEIMADNQGAVSNGGKFPDWIELKNNTNAAIDISGNGLTDDILNPTRYIFPNGTIVPANGYLMVWCDSEFTAPGIHTGFGLSQNGQRVVLTNAGNLRDFINFGPQARNYTIGRIPDGTGNFTLTNPTASASNAAVPTLGSATNLAVNEWMASPAHGDDWFEIYNTDSLPVALSSLWLSDTPSTPLITQLPALSFIAGKGFTDFSADGSNNGGNRCNFKLSAGGERILITTTNGASTLNSITFGSQTTNVSQGRFPDGGTSFASFPQTSSKGESNWLRSPVVINEALTRSLPPLEDYIELRNSSASPVDVGNWWLSDDKSSRQKFQIVPGTIIPAGGLLTISESSFNAGANPFSLSATGDEIILSATIGGTETGYRDQVSFGAATEGIAFGNVATSFLPEFWAQTARTPTTTNAAPLIGSVIINEVHYHPTDLAAVDNTRDEFVEIHNLSQSSVDLSGWKLKGGSDFVFTSGTTIRPGDYILVVGFDPANATTRGEFQAALSVSPATPLLGPFSPKLANDEASVELAFPGVPVLGITPYILADKISYSDIAPWPTSADGAGNTLQRTLRTVIGNDPSNWIAALPTPGAVNSTQAPILDNDGDGIPNSWELSHGLDPFNGQDALLDSDGDGANNLNEFIAQTDPANNADVFLANVTSAPGGGNTISFIAKPNTTYSLLYSNDLTANSWTKLTDIPAGQERTVTESDPSNTTRRFYRVTTPSQP